MSDFILRVLTRQKVVLEARAASVIIPGSEGDFEVLAGHAPLVSAIRPGRVAATMDGTRKDIDVTGGLVVVTLDRVDILAGRADITPR